MTWTRQLALLLLLYISCLAHARLRLTKDASSGATTSVGLDIPMAIGATISSPNGKYSFGLIRDADNRIKVGLVTEPSKTVVWIQQPGPSHPTAYSDDVYLALEEYSIVIFTDSSLQWSWRAYSWAFGPPVARMSAGDDGVVYLRDAGGEARYAVTAAGVKEIGDLAVAALDLTPVALDTTITTTSSSTSSTSAGTTTSDKPKALSSVSSHLQQHLAQTHSHTTSHTTSPSISNSNDHDHQSLPIKCKCKGNFPSRSGALCYPDCPNGSFGLDSLCWATCPNNFIDIGEYCIKPTSSSPTSSSSLPLPSLASSPVACPHGYTDVGGLFCAKPIAVGRGKGIDLPCVHDYVDKQIHHVMDAYDTVKGHISVRKIHAALATYNAKISPQQGMCPMNKVDEDVLVPLEMFSAALAKYAAKGFVTYLGLAHEGAVVAKGSDIAGVARSNDGSSACYRSSCKSTGFSKGSSSRVVLGVILNQDKRGMERNSWIMEGNYALSKGQLGVTAAIDDSSVVAVEINLEGSEAINFLSRSRCYTQVTEWM